MRWRLFFGAAAVAGLVLWAAWDSAAEAPPSRIETAPGSAGSPQAPVHDGSVEVGVPVDAVQTPGNAEQQREAATVAPIPWEERVRRHLATTSSGGDLGAEALRSGLRKALEPPVGEDPFTVAMPAVEELRRNSAINPAGVALDAEEAAQLQGIVNDYGRQLRERRRDRHLASNLGMIEAITAKDFVEKPNGSDPDEIERRTIIEGQKKFTANPGDFNVAEVPGAHLGHNRIIIMTREKYPDYFTAVDAEKLTRAEYDVAIRTFFLGTRRRR